ncbi:MAG: GrpB family protein, partial [Thermoplasmata archaeon]
MSSRRKDEADGSAKSHPRSPLLTEDGLRRVTIGEPQRLEGPVLLVDYDPQWPVLFGREAKRIHSALGARAIRIEHVGSTSVPGLLAKPVIDILLEVADSSDEPSYVPSLEASGYVLRIREPEW